VQGSLTPAVAKRLDVTPGRDVLRVLERFFSWDSCTALLTAMDGLVHRRTDRRVVYNCGMTKGSGHFAPSDRFRRPPFNMIAPEEVWQVFNDAKKVRHRTTPSLSTTARSTLRRGARRLRSLARKVGLAGGSGGPAYYGLNELDRKIARFVTQTAGTFVELGAFDGVTQSNTLSFENKGWRGILVEPVPEAYKACKANRPLAKVFNCACVASTDHRKEIDITAVGLMSLVANARGGGAEEEDWIRRGELVQDLERQKISVPARTLASIVEEAGLQAIDLLSLDVEGHELAVLDGLNLKLWRPRFIVCEDSYDATVEEFLAANRYAVRAVLSEQKHTRDVLYEDLDNPA